MHDSILATVGSPLVAIESPPGTTIAAKVESKNPGGSAKDRPALRMIEVAEQEGKIEPGDRLVEPTSGNTGIGLALVAAAKGYDLTIVMPESSSEERKGIMRAYGADLELVDGDISVAKDRADDLERERGAYQLRQFENVANAEAHYEGTGVEVLDQIGDRTIDALVAGVGTGGTLTGTARRLRERFPAMDVVAVEPAENAVLSTGESGMDEFQGMGPGFVSDVLDTDLLSSVETVSLADAEAECRRLAREEGVLVGQSSGASALAARRVADRIKNAGSNDTGGSDADSAEEEANGDEPLIVTVFWDSGERYLSTGLFE